MRRSRRLAPGAQRALDAALILWTVGWSWMGIAMADYLRGIADLGDKVGGVGRAVTGVGETILGVPLIGDQAVGAAEDLDRAGRDAVASAQSAPASAPQARVHHRLPPVSDDPVGDVRRGRHSALADAQLEWFGMPTRGGR